MFGLTVMPQVVGELGVRTDVPYRELTDDERDIVLHGPAEKRHITVPSKSGKLFELNFTYRNARLAVQEALDKAASEGGLNRVNKFISTETCPTCHGTRLSEQALAPQVDGINLAEATAKTLDERDRLGADGRRAPCRRTCVPMATEHRRAAAARWRGASSNSASATSAWTGASSTLSTGERQRVQLARAVRNQTTGVLYVLDEPSIGLHPSNVDGLNGVIRDLLRDGNSVVLVDHDVQVLREADWFIEIGPGSGSEGGTVLADGTLDDLVDEPVVADRRIPRRHRTDPRARHRSTADEVFDHGRIHLSTRPLHTVHALDVDIPQGPTDRGHRGVRIGQDHAGPGEPRAGAAGRGGR